MMQTYKLLLHALEGEIEHLRKRRFGSRLIDFVLGDEIDVETRAHRQQQRRLVHFARIRRHNR